MIFPMTTGPTSELLKEINAAFNSRDVDRIMSFFAEDCTFLMARGPEPEGRRVHGRAAVRNVLADRFRVITDMRWDHVDSFITGSRAVTVWIVTGTGSDGENPLSRLRPLRVSRRQDPEQGHLLEAGRAARPPLKLRCLRTWAWLPTVHFAVLKLVFLPVVTDSRSP
jgi:ketosteroid isomerase-like protein